MKPMYVEEEEEEEEEEELELEEITLLGSTYLTDGSRAYSADDDDTDAAGYPRVLGMMVGGGRVHDV